MAHAVRCSDVGKELLAAPRDDRMRDEVVLVDELGLDGRRGDRRFAPQDNVAAALTLQARDGELEEHCFRRRVMRRISLSYTTLLRMA